MSRGRLLLLLQPEDCSLKQLSFWLIQNRWHVHAGPLGCTYVRAGGRANERVGGGAGGGEGEGSGIGGGVSKKEGAEVCLGIREATRRMLLKWIIKVLN